MCFYPESAVNPYGANLLNRRLKFFRVLLPLLLIFFTKMNRPAYASDDNNLALVFRGVARTLFSALEIPRSIIENSTGAPFPLNVVTGTVTGAFKTVAGTVMGAADMARGAAPYAKYLVLAL